MLSAVLGVGALVLLVLARTYLARLLRAAGVPPVAADVGARLAPMFLVIGATVLSSACDLAGAGVHTTGHVPSGLPGLNLATSSAHWRALVQPALLMRLRYSTGPAGVDPNQCGVRVSNSATSPGCRSRSRSPRMRRNVPFRT